MIAALTLYAAAPAYSQKAQLEEVEVELTTSDTTIFLGFLISPETVTVKQDKCLLPDSWWTFQTESGQLRMAIPPDRLNQFGNLTIFYEPAPFAIKRLIQRREFEEYTQPTDTLSDETTTIRREIRGSDDLFGEADISQSGSLTRGFTVGNRQDLALDSGLRLDLDGNITDDISILASLTDRSTPIQPDGTTQNIREFDRVFIQLQSPVGELELGDVDLVYDRSRFAKISRRVQGAVGTGRTPVGEFGGGASVTRGRFRTQSFDGTEGVQGPYRLTGDENEAFIIVIAGSETVYIDGVEVNRGAENEYIIDYGLGEIQFTNNLVVTDETRIDVEFQYITQNFTRTLFTAEGQEDELLGGRLSVGATYIREADSKNPATQLNLSDEDIDRLRRIGDARDDLFVSGADSVGFQEDANFVRYAKVDTVLNGEEFEIFKNLPGDPSNVFRVRFTNFGEGNGSYRRIGGAVNGILYEWVGPGEGRYEPVVRLEAPQSHQMLSLQSDLEISSRVRIKGEWAVSEFDQNRFSSIDDDDNLDHAVNGQIEFSDIDTPFGSLRAGAEQNVIGKRFEFFDRQRVVEFDRRWNIERLTDNEQERKTTAYAELVSSAGSFMSVNGGFLNRNQFDGRRGEVEFQLSETGWPDIYTITNYVESSDNLLNRSGDWFKNRGRVENEFHLRSVNMTPFLRWETERRNQRSAADSLLPESLQFYDVNPGLRIRISDFSIEGGLGLRVNQQPFQNSLREESVSRSQRFRLSYRPSGRISTTNSVQFRQKDTNERFIGETTTPRNRSVLVRSATNYSLTNDMLDGELLYEANTERRALLQETYIEAGPELGQFEWIDQNGDGVQQVDEFFPEITPNEGIFIRQFVPADDLLPVIDVTLRSRNELKLGKLVSNLRSGDKGRLEHLVLNSLFEIRETSTEENLSKVYFLNPSVLRDSERSISGQQIVRQRLSWRNESRTAEAAVVINQSRSLTQRAAGLQRRLSQNVSFEGELQVSSPVRLLSAFRNIRSENRNSRFSSRNYDISGYEIEPGVSLFFNRSAQTELRTRIGIKKNRDGGQETSARSYSVESRTQLFLFDRIQNRFRLRIARNTIDGPASGQAEFELTDGVGEGTNILWGVNSDYRATSLLRLSLQYNGRTTTENQIIQTLRLVVSAVF